MNWFLAKTKIKKVYDLGLGFSPLFDLPLQLPLALSLRVFAFETRNSSSQLWAWRRRSLLSGISLEVVTKLVLNWRCGGSCHRFREGWSVATIALQRRILQHALGTFWNTTRDEEFDNFIRGKDSQPVSWRRVTYCCVMAVRRTSVHPAGREARKRTAH
jgi:hypothetical protein